MKSTIEQFSQANSQPFWFKEPERHDLAMREVMEVVSLTSDGGQQFSGLYMNRDFSGTGKPLIAILGAFLSATNGPERKYEAYQYAAAFPENPVQLLDLPLHGLSDGTTWEQKKEIIENKTLVSIARAQAEAIRAKHEKENRLIAIGQSLGGRITPDLLIQAGKLDFKPAAMVPQEMVGVDKKPSLALLKEFYWDEWRAQKLYRENPEGEHLRSAYEVDFKLELGRYGYEPSTYKQYGIYAKDPLGVAAFILRSPLASNTGFESIQEAMDSHPNLFAAIVSGGLSKVNRWRKIVPRVNELIALYPDRLTWDVLPCDTHNIGLAPQYPRLAALTVARVGIKAIT